MIIGASSEREKNSISGIDFNFHSAKSPIKSINSNIWSIRRASSTDLRYHWYKTLFKFFFFLKKIQNEDSKWKKKIKRLKVWMIFKHRELFSKLSLLSKSSIAIEIVFNGTRVNIKCSKCYFSTFDYSFLEKIVSLDQNHVEFLFSN